MGHRNPDRVPLSYRRVRCETVSDMRAQHWDLISKCDVCGLMMQVDLDVIIKVSGPRVSLWNRKPRCRRLGCGGRVTFQARAPGMSWHEELRADDRAPLDEPPAWIAKRGERPPSD